MLWILSLVLAVMPLWCGGVAKAEVASANLKDGVILEGYDAVSYFTAAKPLPGKPTLKADFDGAVYLFADAANRATFVKNPQKYAPAYGGWCATAVAKGFKYDIDPENYKVTDGRLFLFYKGWKGDAKKEWLEDEAKHTKTADTNWPTVMGTQP